LKGIPLKLIAIEQFLEEQPQWRGKLIFNMIGKEWSFELLLLLLWFLSSQNLSDGVNPIVSLHLLSAYSFAFNSMESMHAFVAY
jgi:hypothetical protein